MRACVLTVCLFVGLVSHGEEWKVIEHKVPPPGMVVESSLKLELVDQVKQIEKRVETLRQKVDETLLVDVEVFAKALRWAVDYDEFWKRKGYGIEVAGPVVAEAMGRLETLERGEAPWVDTHGNVVRGYRSAVDGSVQPYGLEIPEGLDLEGPGGKGVPLYVWLHGRGDMKTDVHFIAERLSKPGKLPVKDGIVLHAFGRQCMGFKSAGEIDVLDAIESVKGRYKIDDDRVVLAGFSMGGAGAWHIGAHYADQFCAVHAGAGFVDVKRYQKLKPEVYPPWYTQKLWGVYDVPGYVRNLFNTQMIAYSGANDKQRDAAEYMSETFADEGRELTHVIGPGVEHKYEERALGEVMDLLGEAVAAGRDRWPRQVHVQTKTLRYGKMHWVEILKMDEHWKEAKVDAVWDGGSRFELSTENVKVVRLKIPASAKDGVEVVWDGVKMNVARPGDVVLVERNYRLVTKNKLGRMVYDVVPEIPKGFEGEVEFYVTELDSSSEYVKRPGLQGPIDDAFMEPFLVVTPTGKAMNAKLKRWVDFELKHFKERWRVLYRGNVRVKKDVDVTPDDVAKYHLILWGDPSSNVLIKQWVEKEQQIDWDKMWVTVGTKRYHAENHTPVMVRLNPANRKKYVVINSGPTHREAHDRTNSLQNPKLPDWAVLKIDAAPTGETAGKVVGADFFDEAWKVKATRD